MAAMGNGGIRACYQLLGDNVLVDWKTGIRVFVPDSDYPLTGLLP
jgi:hypothetical protein